MKKLINSTILPVSFCAFFCGVYYILRCFDVPIWLYRGIASILASALLTTIVTIIWLIINNQDEDESDKILDCDENENEKPYKGKVYGFDESQDE